MSEIRQTSVDDLAQALAQFIGVVAIGVVLVGGVIGIRQVAHHTQVEVCRTFAAETGYETKLVDYQWANWDCLAKTENGRWVSTDSLRGVNQ